MASVGDGGKDYGALLNQAGKFLTQAEKKPEDRPMYLETADRLLKAIGDEAEAASYKNLTPKQQMELDQLKSRLTQLSSLSTETEDASSTKSNRGWGIFRAISAIARRCVAPRSRSTSVSSSNDSLPLSQSKPESRRPSLKDVEIDPQMGPEAKKAVTPRAYMDLDSAGLREGKLALNRSDAFILISTEEKYEQNLDRFIKDKPVDLNEVIEIRQGIIARKRELEEFGVPALLNPNGVPGSGYSKLENEGQPGRELQEDLQKALAHAEKLLKGVDSLEEAVRYGIVHYEPSEEKIRKSSIEKLEYLTMKLSESYTRNSSNFTPERKVEVEETLKKQQEIFQEKLANLMASEGSSPKKSQDYISAVMAAFRTFNRGDAEIAKRLGEVSGNLLLEGKPMLVRSMSGIDSTESAEIKNAFLSGYQDALARRLSEKPNGSVDREQFLRLVTSTDSVLHIMSRATGESEGTTRNAPLGNYWESLPKLELQAIAQFLNQVEPLPPTATTEVQELRKAIQANAPHQSTFYKES